MLRYKRLMLAMLFPITLLFIGCGGEGGGKKEGSINQNTDVTGSIQLPAGVATDGEYPASVHAFYTEGCTETPPAPVYSDENGDYAITVNCGADSDGKIYLVYASRSGDYALLLLVTDTSDVVSFSEAVTLQPQLHASVDVQIAEGYNNAFDKLDLTFGIHHRSGADSFTIPIDSVTNVDGDRIFEDHHQTLTTSDQVIISRVPYYENGQALVVEGVLIGNYGNDNAPTNGTLESHRDFAPHELTSPVELELAFINTDEILKQEIRFTTEGEYDPEAPSGISRAGNSATISLSNIPYRQDIFHLIPWFMKNLSVSINGEALVSGEEWQLDLSITPIEDVVLDILNVVSGEASSYSYHFYPDTLDGNTDLMFSYRVDSEIRGIYTNSSNPHFFKPLQNYENYNLYVDYTVNTLELKFTKAEELQQLFINGVAYPEETNFADETYTKIEPEVFEGDNLFEIVVLPENTSASSEYLLTVVKSKPENANLRTLSVSRNFIELLSGFSEEITQYYLTTEEELVGITANAYASANIRLLVNGTEIATGRTQLDSATALEPGVNTIILEVSSADGTVTKQYNIEITRGADCMTDTDLPCTT